MFQEHRVIVVSPAGRRRYLELLIPQILAYRPVVDEFRLWANTKDPEDLAFMEAQAAAHPDFIKVVPLSIPHDGSMSIHSFFKQCIDPKTVYVRFDDDIIALDTLEAFESFLAFRVAHPHYFLVYANILNNAVWTHIHQRLGTLPLDHGISQYACMCATGWKHPTFAEPLHRTILEKKDLTAFRIAHPWILWDNERVSINAISWLGEEFAAFQGAVGRDEEQWLSVVKPRELKRKNAMFGGFVCVHYAFYTQRPHLDTTNVLECYKKKFLGE